MRFWIILVWLLALVVTQPALAQKGQQSETAVCTLKITSMTCGGCEGAVKIAAKSVADVKEVTVSYKTGTARVIYDPAGTTPAAIAKVVTEKSGFRAEVASGQ